MTVFPARRAVPARACRPGGADPRAAGPRCTDPARPTPLDWARRRRAERDARRLEAAGARALGQLDHLGPAWHVVDWPRTDAATSCTSTAATTAPGSSPSAPAGVFAVTVADHGRARVLIAGDVVQINGKRPPYVAEARRDARRASKALSPPRSACRAGHAGADLRRLRRASASTACPRTA